MEVTIATYNIHSCVGTDGRFDPARTAQVIRELAADVVALQEVHHRDFENVDVLDYLARQTGYQAIAGPTLLNDDRDYGNAILTGLPIREVNRIDLSLDTREPRGAIDVILEQDGQALHVVATHLGLSPAERRQQVNRLIDLFDRKSVRIAVLLGDLNEWFLWGRPLRRLRRRFTETPHLRTFPTRFPLFALDQIWSAPRTALVEVKVHRTAVARVASDHFPLMGVLRTEWFD